MPARRSLLEAGAMLLALPGFAEAQDPFPSKPLRCTWCRSRPAAAQFDLVGRTVADRWGRVLGQSIVVENQAGRGRGDRLPDDPPRPPRTATALMQGYVARTARAIRPPARVPYDPLKDFTAIGMIGGTPNVLVVGAGGAGGHAGASSSPMRKKSGAVSLWLGWARFAHAPVDGAVRPAGQREDDACGVPRHRPGVQRPDRRADAGHVPGALRRAAAYPLGPRESRWP